MDAAELTFEEIVRDHYLPAISKRRRANTVNGYVSSLELHVLPRWGGGGRLTRCPATRCRTG